MSFKRCTIPLAILGVLGSMGICGAAAAVLTTSVARATNITYSCGDCYSTESGPEEHYLTNVESDNYSGDGVCAAFYRAYDEGYPIEEKYACTVGETEVCIIFEHGTVEKYGDGEVRAYYHNNYHLAGRIDNFGYPNMCYYDKGPIFDV